MGHKPSNFFQSDRPESGGANHDMSREKSGLTERDKARFASEQTKRESAPREDHSESSSYSIDNEPNNDPNRDSKEP